MATSQRRSTSRRQQERVARHGAAKPATNRMPSLGMISSLALLAGAVVIAAAVILGESTAPAKPAASIAPPVAGKFAGLPTDGFALGRADAPVTIDLYEDFQCPACQRWGQVVFPTLAANELAAGKARLVYHDFAFIGPESFVAARAGHAAALQGRFWDMWSAIYASQGRENSGALASDRLVEIARGLGLDMDRFVADMADSVTGPAVTAANAAARNLGVDSTPTLVVDGRVLVGASYQDLSAAIANAAAN